MSNIIQKLRNEGSLVGYWDFRSGTILDWSGKGNHGTSFGSTPYFTKNGLDFGTGNFKYVAVPDNPSLRLATGCILGLANEGNLSITTNAAFCYKRKATIEYGLYFNAGGIVNNGTVAAGITYAVPKSTKCVASNFTNGAKSNFYLDGVYIGDSAAAGTFTPSNQDLRIGNYTNTVGRISCLCIINRPLTATEHAQLYAELQSQIWPTVPSVRSYFDVKPKVPDNGLVAAWDFGQLNNGTVVDSTGNGRNLTQVNHPVIQNSVVGKAIKLWDEDYFTFNPGFGISGEYSISMVLRPDLYSNTGTNSHHILYRTAGQSIVSLTLNSGLGRFSFSDTIGGSTRSIAATTGIPTGMTVFATFTWNNDKLRIYINGDEHIASASYVGASTFFNASSTCYVGNAGTTVNYDYSGLIKSMSVYNRALSAAEIKSLYESSGLKQIGYSSDFGSPVSTASRGGVTGSNLETTGFRFGSTTPRYTVDTSTINGTTVKTLKCGTAGPLYLPGSETGQSSTELCYGTWDIWINKAASSVTDVYLVSTTGTTADNKYLLRLDSTEFVQLVYNSASMGATAADYIVAGQWYNYKIVRGYNNIFKAYVKSTDGTVRLALTTAAHASVVTGSLGMLLDLDAGDLVSLGSVDGQYTISKKIV